MGGSGAPYDYVRDPDAITRLSFERIRAEARLAHLPGLMRAVAERVVHATANVDAADCLRFTPDAAETVRAALAAGAPILADAHMVARGITRRFLPAGNAVICRLDDDGVAAEAKARSETRSAVAVERWRGDLCGAVCVIGNAPTALFRLLEMLQDGAPPPAAVIGFPVGFVGAEESKQALMDYAFTAAAEPRLPVITMAGRLGGSPAAAAALNAIALGGNP
ncbi:MAG: precorrin-8X methylmutase [Alphaproteobacteria bacterium]|nr:precorrin-8X methylmutase [Alphaproteobacteria bacterium]